MYQTGREPLGSISGRNSDDVVDYSSRVRVSGQNYPMRKTSLAMVSAMMALIASVASTEAHTFAESSSAAKETGAACKALEVVDFTGVLDAPAQVTSAKFVEAHGDVPAYCQAIGVVKPSVGFLLRLPTSHWNGKFYEHGCGGFCGSINLTGEASIAFAGPLRRGYAYLTFDGGHTGGIFSSEWAYNNLQAQIDFGFRGAHVAALAGKAVIAHFYGKPPAKSYFAGCSTGGQQGLSEAQRFPWDFDGIIAGAPSPTFSGPMMNYVWAGKHLSGVVTQSDLAMLHEKVLQQCDLDDGVSDGVVSDPRHCRVNPAKLLCKSGQTTNCLSGAKVDAIEKVYAGPTTSTGEKIYTGGPLPGSELNWINDDPCCAYVNSQGIPDGAPTYFQYAGFMPAPGPSWKIQDFDFDRDYKRLRTSESLFGAADNPDLRKFKAAGGKLLMYQGLQDESDIPADAIDYYETTEKTMGGRASTQDFFRLFVIPGMNHCSGGPGPYAVDYLAYLEPWVEQGRAPDMMLGAHVKNKNWLEAYILSFPLDSSTPITFTRPIYPYPTLARYAGQGNPNDAVNWGPNVPQ